MAKTGGWDINYSPMPPVPKRDNKLTKCSTTARVCHASLCSRLPKKNGYFSNGQKFQKWTVTTHDLSQKPRSHRWFNFAKPMAHRKAFRRVTEDICFESFPNWQTWHEFWNQILFFNQGGVVAKTPASFAHTCNCICPLSSDSNFYFTFHSWMSKPWNTNSNTLTS